MHKQKLIFQGETIRQKNLLGKLERLRKALPSMKCTKQDNVFFAKSSIVDIKVNGSYEINSVQIHYIYV